MTSQYSPFGLYDTFSPIVLKGKVVMVASSDITLARTIAMETARVGASVVLAHRRKGAHQRAAEEIIAYGRPVLEVHGDLLEPGGTADMVRQAVQAVERIDLLVYHLTLGMALSGAAAITLAMDKPGRKQLLSVLDAAADELAGPSALALILAVPEQELHAEGARVLEWSRGLIEELAERVKPHGVRANALLARAADTASDELGEPPGTDAATAQQLAWSSIFLASGAAAGLTGHCLALSPLPHS